MSVIELQLSSREPIRGSDALIIVDVQNDFLPGGSLAVPVGDRVIDPINAISARFKHVVATRCWHPHNHISFAAQGGPWPEHCVQKSPGAAFAARLALDVIDEVFSKGADPSIDAYSGFSGTGLDRYLRERSVRRVFIAGLATDYCVKATAIDAHKNGFHVWLLTDAVAAVDVTSGDGEHALRELRALGVRLFETTGLEL